MYIIHLVSLKSSEILKNSVTGRFDYKLKTNSQDIGITKRLEACYKQAFLLAIDRADGILGTELLSLDGVSKLVDLLKFWYLNFLAIVMAFLLRNDSILSLKRYPRQIV